MFSALEIERSRGLKVEQLKRRLESEQARMESGPRNCAPPRKTPLALAWRVSRDKGGLTLNS